MVPPRPRSDILRPRVRRALDWDIDGPFQDYPQVTVYHSDGSDAQGGTFANVGWTGWIGSITGMSAAALGISEIGVTFPDPTFGKESRAGTPFTFLLRDVLQFETSLGGARDHIGGAKRTCNLILGVGDGKPQPAGAPQAPFNSMQVSSTVANFINDTHFLPVNDSWHKPIDQIVYHGMDWLCPAFSATLHDQLASLRGSLTPANAISHVMSITQTGDLLSALYDLVPSRLKLYVANARGAGEGGAVKAYDRQYVEVDLKAAFAMPKPTAVEA